MPQSKGEDRRIRDDFIPASDWFDPRTLRLERERMWPKVWQIACRLEEIPEVGDFVNYRIFDESILVTRTSSDRIQAFYNTCQHRGRRLRDEDRGRAGQWYCRFHGWKYELGGKIVHVHDREDWSARDCQLSDKDISLKEVVVDTWAGWVWINQDADCEPLRTYLAPVCNFLDPFEFEKARMAWYETIVAPVNWKVVVEAFNETYHAGATHTNGFRYTGLRGPGVTHGRHAMFYGEAKPNQAVEYLDPDSNQWVTAKSAAEAIWAAQRHQYRTLFSMTLEPLMAAAERLKNEGDRTPVAALPARLLELHREELEKRGVAWPKDLNLETVAKAGVDWHIFPNSIVLPTTDSALWYRVRPNGDDPDSCIFDIWSLGRYAPGLEPKVERGLNIGFESFKGKNPFLEEDFGNMEAVQAGMKSAGFHGARLNPVQEVQIANFHRVLQQYTKDKGAAAQ